MFSYLAAYRLGGHVREIASCLPIVDEIFHGLTQMGLGTHVCGARPDISDVADLGS